MEHLLLGVLGAYLLGSIPSGLVVAKYLQGMDPRTLGSGNIGAANLYRTLGPRAGIMTLGGDALKGAVPVLAARFIWPGPGMLAEVIWAAVGLAAVAGHLWPVYLGFRGGKGVATAFGVIAALSPLTALTTLFIYGLILGSCRIFSLASMAGAWLLPVAMGLWSSSKIFLILSGILSILIVWRHKSNITRLALGQEPRITSSKGS